MRHNIILMTGGTETLEFFSLELNKAFQELGYETFLFDLKSEEESAALLHDFSDSKDSILITFNFEGIHYITALFDGNGNYFWDQRQIPCFNIVVDHPYFYPELFTIRPIWFFQFCIDRFHLLFMERFYPEISRGPFFPLAGTSLYPKGDFLPLSERPYDIVFTGNYTPPERFEPQITRLNKEYEDFYRNILQDLISNPDQPDDLVMERHLLREMPDSSPGELRQGMNSMLFIDAYIRFYFRGLVVRTLIDSGIKIHCIGQGWDKLPCKHPENLSYETDLLSYDCLVRHSQARLSLNVMPWFKDGAHDRVFNAMANGAVCITDHSNYLDHILEHRKNVIFYDLKEIHRLPEEIKDILDNPSLLEQIQKNAFQYTMQNHTWKARASALEEFIVTHLD